MSGANSRFRSHRDQAEEVKAEIEKLGRKALDVLQIMKEPMIMPWEKWLASPQKNFQLWGMRHAQKGRK